MSMSALANERHQEARRRVRVSQASGVICSWRSRVAVTIPSPLPSPPLPGGAAWSVHPTVTAIDSSACSFVHVSVKVNSAPVIGASKWSARPRFYSVASLGNFHALHSCSRGYLYFSASKPDQRYGILAAEPTHSPPGWQQARV